MINPATEELVAPCASSTPRRRTRPSPGAAAAVAAWRAVAPGDRARLLRRFAEAVDAHVEELAALEVANSGHTDRQRALGGGQRPRRARVLRGAPERLIGRQIPVPGGIDVTFHEPLGRGRRDRAVELPDADRVLGHGPALAAGNTVVLKPAELTPLTALRLAELALDAGMPEDVFQVLPGKGTVVGQRLVDHPVVRKVCFTGSTAVGKRIMAACAPAGQAGHAELGGKSANIVFADADLERPRRPRPYAVFDNAGQDCCARSRILVQRTVLRPVHGTVRAGRRGRAGRRPGR